MKFISINRIVFIGALFVFSYALKATEKNVGERVYLKKNETEVYGPLQIIKIVTSTVSSYCPLDIPPSGNFYCEVTNFTTITLFGKKECGDIGEVRVFSDLIARSATEDEWAIFRSEIIEKKPYCRYAFKILDGSRTPSQ